jgi:dTDP-4-amino-4,6-dideoxygalactose transaminase
VAATSFYPAKNLGAYGDAGAVLCRDDELAIRVRQLRNYGGLDKYEHQVPGYNSRLDELQAVVLEAKLRRLDDWSRQRTKAAARYEQLLCGADAVRTPPPTESTHAWHLYVVRVPGRDEVVRTMRRLGIEAGVHYPTALHQLPAFAHLGHRAGDFPRAERCAEEVLSLPMHPHLQPSVQEEVAEVLVETVDRGGVPQLAGLAANGGGRL